MKGLTIHKIWDIFTSVLAILFIITGTIFAYFYAQGYRFNPIDGGVKQTGVLSVQALPSKSDIFVNDQNIGKSPKVSSVDIGDIKVKIEKDGYISWEKNIPIVAEKSTSIAPILFLKNPQAESVYSTNGKIVQKLVSPSSDSILAIIQTDREYKIMKYELSKRFWNISENPQFPYTTDSKGIRSMNMEISKDSRWALLTKTLENKSKTYELVKLTLPYQTIKSEDLPDFSRDYTIKWSQDSNFLVMESANDIITYRVPDETKYLLLKKNSKTKYIWNTDSEGFFYYTSLEKEGDKNKFSIIQMTLQGTSKKTILKDIYFQSSTTKVTELKNNNTLSFDSMENSKTDDIFSGELQSFQVIPGSNGVFMSTNQATYWYNQEDNKYILIHTSPSTYLSTSPDQNKLIFFDSSNYYTFAFKTKEEDPTATIGTHIFAQGDKISDVKWLGNSTVITYVQDGKIVVTEFDGTNNNILIESGNTYGFSNNTEYIYMISTPKELNTLEVLRYRVH